MQHQMIFVNLPVADLQRSRDFFRAMGYSFNEKFCDDNALSLVLGENLFAMLLRRDFFQTFHDKDTVDATKASEVAVCLSAGSREEVDTLIDKAVSAGGSASRTEDHGFMYGRGFEDPDGHHWEYIWMDPAAAEQGPEEYVANQQGESGGPQA